MDIALAIVDILAGNQHPSAQKNRTNWKCWKCGLTAGMEDKIIRLIGSETMDMAPECGIIELPQMSRQPEGSTT